MLTCGLERKLSISQLSRLLGRLVTFSRNSERMRFHFNLLYVSHRLNPFSTHPLSATVFVGMFKPNLNVITL